MENVRIKRRERPGGRDSSRRHPIPLPTADRPIFRAMKIGVLTAGGDCPGLNAVIRAVTRKSLAAGHEVVGLWRGYAGLAERSYVPLDMRVVSGILPLGGTILSTSSYDPYRHEDGVEKVREAVEQRRVRRRRRDRRRAHDEHHAQAARGRAPDDRRAEDDRQRRSLHRPHVRIRHRGPGRDRRDRPPPHDGRVPRPRDGDRGDGPQHGLDRGLQRHRRRRRRDRDPRARADRRGDRRLDQRAPQARQELLDRGRRGGRRAGLRVRGEAPDTRFDGDRQLRLSAARRHRPGARPRRSRSAPASRRASRRSGTSSAAVRRRPRTACSPPATG